MSEGGRGLIPELPQRLENALLPQGPGTQPSAVLPQGPGIQSSAEVPQPQGGSLWHEGLRRLGAERYLPQQDPSSPEPQSFLRSILPRARSTSPPPGGTAQQGQAESPVVEELQAQAMQKGSSSSTSDNLKAGSNTLAPLPDHKGGAEASLRFQDWMEITATTMTDISEKSGQWWKAVTLIVEAAYARWLAASHMERLAVQPEGMEQLCQHEWARINARACSMLVAAMGPELKADMIAQRITQYAPALVFRLYTWYQPGGSAERQEILRRLQSPFENVNVDAIEAVLAEVRSWPRWLARCQSIGMLPPDPSVMSKGLQALTTKQISSSADATFRTSMLRSTLRLDCQPTLEQVKGYQRHLQAELESLAGAQQASSSGGTPSLRAAEVSTTSTSPKSQKTKEKSQELCRYFARANGCKRGDKCVYSHSMQGMERDQRANHHNDLEHPMEVIQNQAPGEGDSSPEKTKAEVRTITVKDIRISSVDQRSTALLDSGATHSLRSAYNESEWKAAEEVDVHLAGGGSLRMRLSKAGSLLMPPRTTSPTSSTTATVGGQTIVPLGELVKVLGYSLEWSPKGCFLKDGDGNARSLGVSNGCPHLKEAEALALIARLEDRKMEMLENATALTQDSLDKSLLVMESSWKEQLYKYVGEGNMQAGLRAVRDAPFLAELPGECVDGLVQDSMGGNGWATFKKIEFLSRSQRRRLYGAKRWIIHLYAGSPGHHEVFRLDDGGTVVLELDVQRCKAHDLLKDSTWKMVSWAAMNGRVEAIIGGPPGRGGLYRSYADDGAYEAKGTQLVARMLWLYAMADAGRNLKAQGMDRGRPVALMLEHPTGASEEEKGQRFYSKKSLWELAMWRDFATEYGMSEVKFDQKETGLKTSLRTTLGTNIYYLMGLDGLGLEEQVVTTGEGNSTSEWSPGLVRAVVMSLRFWIRHPQQAPRLAAFTPEQWKRHVDSNHMDYRRDCLTCVMSRGTGRRHARVHHPEMFALTIDLAGPVKPGLDVTSKGTMGKSLKYMMVARYVMPKEYVKAYSSVEPPRNHGMDQVQGNGEEDQELAEPSLLPPRDEGGRVENDKSEDKELPEPSLLPPRDEGDPFIVLDEPGEGSPLCDVQNELDSDRQWDEATRFLGGTGKQRKDYEDSMYEFSDGEPDPVADQDDEGSSGGHRDQHPDCEAPESTYLLFAKALPTNGSSVVKAAIQDVVLYLQSRGLPVFRLHADRGETFNHSVRAWLRDQGIRATWSEPGIPQGNGQAESTVRWVKDMARSLLIGSKLPTRLWPTAVEAATALQRAKVLSWKSKLVAPYGSVVHVKQKAFDSSGPRRRERAFETKWIKGQYVGLSGLLDNGHVVFVPGDGDRKEKFVHTFHVRPRLVDPGVPEQELQIEDPPRPRRKIPVKTPIHGVEMKGLQLSEEDLVNYIQTRCDCLLQDWDQEEAIRFVDELSEKGIFEDIKFGVFRHGGSVGWLRGFAEYPGLAKVLSRIIVHVNPEATFTAIWVAKNSERGMHKDFNNDEAAVNYVMPVRMPSKGGELWVELAKGDEVRGAILQRQDEKGKAYFGQVHQLVEGQCHVFSPRRRHEVLPWEGTRTVVIAYTPQGLGKLTNDMIRELEDHGYPPPITQFPEYFLKDPSYNANSVNVSQEECELSKVNAVKQEFYDKVDPIVDEDVDDWEMYIEAEDGYVKIAETEEERQCGSSPRMRKVEAGYTKGVEAILEDLKAPLEVVYNVDPREVLANLSAWEPAIRKEVDGVAVAIQRLLPGTTERRAWIQRPAAQRLPTKMVFTIKPGDAPVPNDKTTWYKRKARLVVCGNFAADDNAEVYTETPPTEAIRAGLVFSQQKKWSVALLDIVAAFLRTPLNPEEGDPVIIVAPPKLLERLLITIEGELWGLVRALYGLRQAPALWATHRDKVLRNMEFGGNLRLHRGRTITAWWTLRDDRDTIKALVIIYVDDIVLIAPEDVVNLLAREIQKVWKTSELGILNQDHALRVLGMELEMGDDNETIYVSQKGYIEEILRSYGIPDGAKDKIPLGKEMASFEATADDVEPDQKAVADSQKITGELMWVSQKTRPDLSYTCSLMSALTLRAPHRCVEIGRKVLRYLNATKEMKMVIKNNEEGLTLYPDAAFAPSSNRSQTGWAIYWCGTPLAWRSGRQGAIALSTAESELQAILDGAIGMMSIEAMLCDIKVNPSSKAIASDSTSALAIGAGTGSWIKDLLKLWLMHDGATVDKGLMEVFMTMLMVLGAVVLWEASKTTEIAGCNLQGYRTGASEDSGQRAIDYHVFEDGTVRPDDQNGTYEPWPGGAYTSIKAIGNRIKGTKDTTETYGKSFDGPILGLDNGGQFETERLSTDVLQLFTVESLKEGLRHEGMAVSGLKVDLARRLSSKLVTRMSTRYGPTQRQLRYILWLWRHSGISARYVLKWEDINDKVRISNLIHEWKDK
ncbi:TY5A [Symbiodinium sp. CCMP2592]|nr:TY5A [Symbiodinium sp. CCMP2592]